MGIDGIEFHPCYHQNLGTFQEVWAFPEQFFGSNLAPPLVKTHVENTIKKSFFSIQGVEV